SKVKEDILAATVPGVVSAPLRFVEKFAIPIHRPSVNSTGGWWRGSSSTLGRADDISCLCGSKPNITHHEGESPMSFFPFSLFRLSRERRPLPRSARRHAALCIEVLEDRMLLSAAVISGFVYNDANHNGLFDPGESPIASNPIKLLDASGTLVA